MKTRLQEYLDAIDGSFGCRARYDAKVTEENDNPHPYLAGHYAGLLSDVVRLVGKDRLQRLAAVVKEIDELGEPGGEERR